MFPEKQPVGADAFAERLIDVLNSGMLALTISLGAETGLFDVLAGLPPSTSDEIAAASGLYERYVREWLAAMAVGGIILYDPGTTSFQLPVEHYAALNKVVAGPGRPGLGAMMGMVRQLARTEDKVVDCFRRGGGVSNEEFRAVWTRGEFDEEPGPLYDASLLEGALPLVPEVVERLEKGIDVADVGCGEGPQLNVMAQRFPASRFVGYDFYAEESMAWRRAEAKRNGLDNVRYERKDAAELDGSELFDFITTFDSVHDQARPDAVLRAIARSLRPGGVYLCVDVAGSSSLADNLSDRLGSFKYAWSVLFCTPASLAYGGIALGTMWGEQLARKMISEAGFASVETVHLPGDLGNCYHIARMA